MWCTIVQICIDHDPWYIVLGRNSVDVIETLWIFVRSFFWSPTFKIVSLFYGIYQWYWMHAYNEFFGGWGYKNYKTTFYKPNEPLSIIEYVEFKSDKSE